MKRFLPTIIGLLLGGASAFAANISTLSPSPNFSEASQIVGTLNTVIQNVNTQGPGLLPSGLVGGLPAATTGTTIQALGTVTLPASFLANIGQGVRVTCWGAGTNTGTNTLTIQFGTATALAVSPGATTTATFQAKATIIKTGASTQQIWQEGQYNATWVTPTNTSGTQTDTSSIAITCSGTSTTSTNFTLNGMFVEVLK